VDDEWKSRSFTSKGFAGAHPQEFENTVMVFLHVIPDMDFANGDYGYGPVNAGINIAFLSEMFEVLSIEYMEPVREKAMPPEGTKYAVEGLRKIVNEDKINLLLPLIKSLVESGQFH